MRCAIPSRQPGLKAAGGAVARRRRHQRPALLVCAAAHHPTAGLKEWAPLVYAASCGRVTAFVRKGGIREAGFSLAGAGGVASAVLVPTSFHADASALTPALASATPRDVLAFDQRGVDPLPLTVGAAFTAAWTVRGPADALVEFLGGVAACTGLGPAAAASRAAPLRGAAPGAPTTLTLVELRVCALRDAHAGLAQATPGLWGCRSWVDLPPAPPASWALGPPVLDAGAWAGAQARLRRGLEGGALPAGVTVQEVGVLS